VDGQGLGIESGGGSVSFSDTEFLAAEVQDAISAAQEAGLLMGYGDGTFGPYDMLTRAQAATVMKRVMDKYTEMGS
jgi:hypothetical protein